MGDGGYQSSFDIRTFMSEWTDRLKDDLGILQTLFSNQSHTHREWSERTIAAELHSYRLNDFYSNLGKVSDFVSHHTCFSCLRELPEHPLPCGHVLCSPCINVYGKKVSRTTIELARCPLHLKDWMWDPPWVITVKPPFAGTRILSLDG